MKFCFPDIDYVFDTEIDKINTIVIENQSLFMLLISDINNQLTGNDGKSVLSSNATILQISKNVELLDRFIPFVLNSKSLITKITSCLEERAVSDKYYSESTEIVGQIDSFLARLSFEYPCDIKFSKINISSVIKASGVEICEDYDNLAEKIIDYFELITEFIGEKLFITVNLRSYISDKEASLLMKTVIMHGYHLIMLESSEHNRLEEEKRLIVDSDYCIIN